MLKTPHQSIRDVEKKEFSLLNFGNIENVFYFYCKFKLWHFFVV
jgi:hypothetical protein